MTMTMTKQLRKLATELRETARRLEEDKLQKSAQILVAAQGLNTLRKRLGK